MEKIIEYLKSNKSGVASVLKEQNVYVFNETELIDLIKQLTIPVVSLIDWDFIDWLDRGMWSNNENTSEGIVRQELWYNTYNFSAMKNPLTKEQLYDKYKATLDEG